MKILHNIIVLLVLSIVIFAALITDEPTPRQEALLWFGMISAAILSAIGIIIKMRAP